MGDTLQEKRIKKAIRFYKERRRNLCKVRIRTDKHLNERQQCDVAIEILSSELKNLKDRKTKYPNRKWHLNKKFRKNELI